MTAVTTFGGAEPVCSAPDAPVRTEPDPLDDATHHFASTPDPYPYARFGGRLPPLHPPAPRPPALNRARIRFAVATWSAIDVLAFLWTLRHGPSALAALAAAGLAASAWHLRDASRRSSVARRLVAGRHCLPAPARHLPASPTTSTPRHRHTRRPFPRHLHRIRSRGGWTRPEPALVAAGAMVAGVLVHLAAGGSAPLP